MKARKKPVEVEVIQLRLFSPMSYRKCKEFVGDSWINYGETPSGFPGIRTLEGVMEISDNDYIIKGVDGEFYPCKPDIFKKTYEVIEWKHISYGGYRAMKEIMTCEICGCSFVDVESKDYTEVFTTGLCCECILEELR